LIDPPLHEFLPHTEDQQRELAGALGVGFEDVRRRVEQLHESNPMLGHRGCRLAITYPEILEMQVRAIMEAAVECRRREIRVSPEIMIPLCIDAKELGILVDRTREVADGVLKEAGVRVKYLVGTMVETPRAALTAGRLAEVSDFFSFGTNDLTQTVMALSRDDAGRFLPEYVDPDKAGIFSADPFQTIDREGVGVLVELAIASGRKTKPKLKIGICGEHGGDVESVRFCHEVGMDYVSCSPYRVPIARLGAAQAVIEGATRAPSKRPGGSRRKAAARPAAKKSGKARAKVKAKAKTRRR
jgi:pyruvate,orthophosphate dikinase